MMFEDYDLEGNPPPAKSCARCKWYGDWDAGPGRHRGGKQYCHLPSDLDANGKPRNSPWGFEGCLDHTPYPQGEGPIHLDYYG